MRSEPSPAPAMQEPERGAPAASARPDLDTREGEGGDTAGCQLSPGSERDGAPQPQEESSGTPHVPPPDPQRVHSAPELVRPPRAMDRTDRSPQSGADYSFLVSQNTKLLSALEDLRHRCSSLAQENSLLRRSCFPQTEEKVKHLKRKNAELAVIAKRLEERARKLQEANLKVDDPHCLNVIEFDRLLRESQQEVLRLQRQIALKNFKE
ncbi:PREDICTED: peripheral-type benzodiazepine receptor-associated protein 1-like, partial [Pseudopodoces humilis]|uniref:peripheral-type benzodiazepine receptor-associated protein 1-like n=1 Tax=Pseudopodoces humilis TaxID=181119 RepID=UPI0006B72B10